MVRVTVRFLNKDAVGKIFRFNEPLDFNDLLIQIASKLGVEFQPALDPDPKNQTLSGLEAASRKFDLYLGDNVLVEHVNEIDDGDDLVLKLKAVAMQMKTEDVKIEGQMKEVSKPSKSVHYGSNNSCNGNGSEDGAEDGDNSSQSYIEDITDQILEERQKQKERTIELVMSDSSDSKDEENISTDDDNSNGNDDEDEDYDDDDDEDYEEHDDDDIDFGEDVVNRKRKRAVPPPSPPESPLKVIMKEHDIPTAPGKPNPVLPREESSYMNASSILQHSADSGKSGNRNKLIKDRIIKLLNTGFHEKSNENEAKNAIKLAQRLMKKYDLSQAVLLQARRDATDKKGVVQDEDGEILKGGMVEVHIIYRKTKKPALLARWINNLMAAISKNFVVENFYRNKRGRRCSITFYGVYMNCQLAAYAFCVSTERIAQMCAVYKPDSSSYCSTKSARLSYALGIVKGIRREVDTTLKRDKERREEKLARAQIAMSKGEAYEESEDDDGVSDSNGDGESGYSIPVKKVMKVSSLNNAPTLQSITTTNKEKHHQSPTKKIISGKALNKHLRGMRQEKKAALTLVDHRKKVAEQVLEKNKIKIKHAAKRKPILFDKKSYQKGIEDSKDIDINQRAIWDKTRIK